MHNKMLHYFFLISAFSVAIWSAIKPQEFFTWKMEVPPVLIGIIIIIYLYPRFKFTNLAYFLLWLQALTMLAGGHYTYSDVPFFNVLRDTFYLTRNYYDRLGHFLQGLGLAIAAREVFIRKSPVKKGWWLVFFIVCFCMAFGALYELYECGVVLVKGADAGNFIGLQGDEWDAQWDMFSALVGVLSALLFLTRIHDRQLSKIKHLSIDKLEK